MADFNHTIVHATDKAKSAAFLCDILGLPQPTPFGHFLVVKLGNGVSLDYMQTDQDFGRIHYAFLVSDAEFDHGLARVKALGLEYWAEPFGEPKGQINTHFGGRGFYFRDPDGHHLELITRPYGKEEDL